MELFKKCKRIAPLLLFCNIIMLCQASVAYPDLVGFKQHGGSVVKVKMRGDENIKWAETEDGYTLLYDKVGNLVYAELDKNGDLVPTDIVATDVAQRTMEVRQHLQSTPKKLFFSESQLGVVRQIRQARAAQLYDAGPQKAATGAMKMLVILVDYPDCAFQKTKDDFDKLFNQLNYTDGGRQGSVRDFYKENSFGQLDLTADIAGVYRLPNNRAYYGAQTTAGANDIRPQEMAQAAMNAANNNGYNTSNYSIVHIIYAGRGEESGGGSDCIWAHSWTVNNKKYSCSSELRAPADPYDTATYITHIGVICHEVAHTMGTQDFYDTDGSTGGDFDGTGMWDIMADGEWLAGGSCPAHFNPYTKIYDFGWASPTIVNGRSQHKLYAKSKDGFVRINTSTSNEYFLIEYRVQKGFDKEIPGHGLMIYRASEGLSKHSSNTINAGHKQQFYPIAANAKYSLPSSDPSSYGIINSYTAPFPGNNNVDEFTDMSVPSMKSWSGANTNLPITSIDEFMADGYIVFDVAAPFTYSSITPATGTAESLSTITLKFPKAASINTGAGSISLKSSNSSYYASNIIATMSDDGLTATITSTPSNSRWTIGQTYTLTIPSGYFVANSNNRSYEAISCSWTIVPETFTYLSVSPGEGELQEIKDIMISFPNDIISVSGSTMPTLNITDANGTVVRTITTHKTKDVNNNTALMATVSPSIIALGEYTLAFPAGVLKNDSYGSMLNRAFDIKWDVVLPPVEPTVIKPVGNEVYDLSTISISFNEAITLNPNLSTIIEEFGDISITSDDPSIFGKDFNITISEDGFTANITCSPSYGTGWIVGKKYTLNVPSGYFIGTSGGTNKVINRSWTIVPERFFPSDITPAEGEIGRLEKIVIGFDRTIYILGSPSVDIKDGNDNVVRTSTLYRAGNAVEITINPAITTPGTYTFVLPAGSVSDNIRFNSGLHNGDINLTWNVVNILANSVVINNSELDLEIGSDATLIATVLPTTATSHEVRWISSDENIATVDQNGVVTAIAEGEAMITAMTVDGSNVFGACHVKVTPVKASSLTLDKEDVTLMLKETTRLTVSILPELAVSNTIVIWSSSDNTVATVDQNGVVTAVAVGEAIIEARVEDSEIKDTCVVNVGSILGDTNSDGTVTVTDIVVVASYILGDDVPGFVPASADLNSDEKVNVTDIVLLTNIILGENKSQRIGMQKVYQETESDNTLYIDNFKISVGETKRIAINLDNVNKFTAFQADLRLPNGLEMCKENGAYMIELSDRKGEDHTMVTLLREDGTIRLLSYSLGLNEYAGSEGALVYFTVRASENFVGTFRVALENIAFVQSDCTEADFMSSSAEVVCSTKTVVGTVDTQTVAVTVEGNEIVITNATEGAEVAVYAANGALIRKEKASGNTISIEVPSKGIYIVKVGNQIAKVAI